MAAGSTHDRDSPATVTSGGGERSVPGLPVHFGQARAGEVAALDAGADHGGDHPVDPVAFPGGRRGVDDLLHVAGLDVLADDRVNDRGGEPGAQSALAIGMLARPPVLHRAAAGVQVVGDEVGAGPAHVRRVGPEPFGDFLQPGGQLVFAYGLAVLPLAVFVPDRPPPVSVEAGRVHRDPAVQLDHRAAGRIGGLLPAYSSFAATLAAPRPPTSARSSRTASRLLRRLAKEEKLELRGERRGSEYIGSAR
jgi:hypothetical protein